MFSTGRGDAGHHRRQAVFGLRNNPARPPALPAQSQNSTGAPSQETPSPKLIRAAAPRTPHTTNTSSSLAAASPLEPARALSFITSPTRSAPRAALRQAAALARLPASSATTQTSLLTARKSDRKSTRLNS